ncbi:MAG: thioredoxin family protein [Thiohalorhabdus sp.]|uniref:thioredoxin family protein n=1 Tax=Thiohalorhabdus sp. TaxID=3094134 RepID=UPI002FC32F4C
MWGHASCWPAVPRRPSPPGAYPFRAYDEGLSQAQEQDKEIFLYVGREGCAFCERTNQETFSDAEIKERFTDHYGLVYVDSEGADRLRLPSGERVTARERGSRLEVVGTPLFAMLDPEGTALFRMPGFKTVGQFKRMDRYIQSGAYRDQP